MSNDYKNLMTIPFRSPSKYDISNLPVKLPPPTQILSLDGFPILGYMEQSVARCIINALSQVGQVKPKYPFLSPTQSSLLYIALHLKGVLVVYVTLFSVIFVSLQ